MSRPQASAYSIRDMAEDTLSLMDALGCESAHALGCSMGGMVGDRDRAPGAPANAAPRLTEPHVDSYLRLVAESWRAMGARLEREDFAHDGSSPAARAGGRARAAPDARGRLVGGGSFLGGE